MQKRPLKVLGISPGTRYIGYAVFSEEELSDWGIKNIEGKWSKKKMTKVLSVISDLIGRYRTDVLSIKALHPSRTSANLDRVVSEIKGLAKSKGMRIYQYSIEELKGYLCPYSRINRHNLVEVIAERYPILSYELDRERTIVNPYHIRMFESVALGFIVFSKLNRRR